MKPIISVKNLSKQYVIGARQTPYKTLRESITETLRAPFNRFGRNGNSEENTIWALKDVTFEIYPGEAVGVIGRNGAGKSTLLKILSRITEPTTGQVNWYGRVASLLEIGTGFHPELTGRENVYLNGAILGMKKSEIKNKFDEIVAFAEIDKFIETPVKYYSSGMYVRLAFAVAAHLEPEILVVDEVLAVGDSGFQNKCIERMRSLARGGCSLLFVSHNMSAVQSFCTRGLLFKNGLMERAGDPAEIIEAYFKDVHADARNNALSFKSSPDLKIINVQISRDGITPSAEFQMGDSLFVTVEYESERPIARPYFSFGITEGGTRPLALASMLIDGKAPELIEGKGSLTCCFRDLPLMPRAYQVWGSVRGDSKYGDIVDWQHMANFRVTAIDGRVALDSDPSLHHLQNDAPVYLSYDWIFGNEARIENK